MVRWRHCDRGREVGPGGEVRAYGVVGFMDVGTESRSAVSAGEEVQI